MAPRARTYTCRGDGGETDLPAAGRVSKCHLRVAACGALDELNCAVGETVSWVEAFAASKRPHRGVRRWLLRIQRELFVLGSLVSGVRKAPRGHTSRHGAAVRRLESEIDVMTAELPECRGFILPGGGVAASAAHRARAICRRAERDCVAAVKDDPIAEAVLPYLNRLGHWLFVLARRLSKSAGGKEEFWRGPVKAR